jgi:hypothetical protein
MKNVKAVIIGCIGILISTGICTIFIFSSADRVEYYKNKYLELTEINLRLTESVREREAIIEGLQYNNYRLTESNRQFEASIREREAIIKGADITLQSTVDSILKLEQILYALEEIEQIWIDNNSN